MPCRRVRRLFLEADKERRSLPLALLLYVLQIVLPETKEKCGGSSWEGFVGVDMGYDGTRFSRSGKF